MERRYHFTTKDLVTIALLSALGGGLSTYVGYLGNLINRMVGVPFGAGQFMAGLHVIWIVLAVGITKKKGVGTATGLLKGMVELFMGGTHGVVIVAVSLVQGAIVDMVLFRDSTKENRDLIPYSLAGGFAAASNVFVFQIFFFAGVPMVFIMMISMLAFASGIIFGGYITLQMMFTLEQGGLITRSEKNKRYLPRYVKYTALAVTIIFLMAFTVGGVYYFNSVYVSPGAEEIMVNGGVNSEFSFVYGDFENSEVTVTAEMVGSVSYEAEREYRGIPLYIIVQEAEPLDDNSIIVVRATDGYSARFDLHDVMDDPTVVITYDDGYYRVVAKGYDGAYWVRDVYEIRVDR